MGDTSQQTTEQRCPDCGNPLRIEPCLECADITELTRSDRYCCTCAMRVWALGDRYKCLQCGERDAQQTYTNHGS